MEVSRIKKKTPLIMQEVEEDFLKAGLKLEHVDEGDDYREEVEIIDSKTNRHLYVLNTNITSVYGIVKSLREFLTLYKEGKKEEIEKMQGMQEITYIEEEGE